jgi:glycerol-3-phosphate dehydrogenase
MLKALKAAGAIQSLRSDTDEEFDVLIVGGGATGAGCAVDAASRGLKVGLVERDDFGAGKWEFSFYLAMTCHRVF